MLVDAGPGQALAVADRILNAAEQTPVPFDARTLEVHLSAGLSICTPEDQNLMAVLKRADIALYRAKEQGRNRVRAS